MADSTARINAQHLATGQFNGQMVRAVGKLTAVDEASQQVQLQLSGEGPFATAVCGPQVPLALFPADKANVGYYEVIGTLRQNGVIESMTAISLGDSMDMAMYDEMVKLTHQFPDVF